MNESRLLLQSKLGSFSENLISLIAFKDIIATLKICDYSMIYLNISEY